MDKDYTTYSADQLLNDDFFIQSELHPTEKSRAFWSDLQIKSAALSQEIENARLFLHTIKIDRNWGCPKSRIAPFAIVYFGKKYYLTVAKTKHYSNG